MLRKLGWSLGVLISIHSFAAEPVLHSNPETSRKAKAALLFVGNPKMAGDLVNEMGDPAYYDGGFAAMIDSLVRRQGSSKPFTAPVAPFKDLGVLLRIQKANPNKTLLPRLSTERWSEELRAALFPIIRRQKIGTPIDGGDDYLLTAVDIFSIVSDGAALNAPPLPGEKQSPKLFTYELRQQLRDDIADLAIRYEQAIKAGPRAAPPQPAPAAEAEIQLQSTHGDLKK